MSLVSFVRVKNNNYATLKSGIEESLKLINFDFDGSMQKIVIKPNMCCYYHPSTGEVTDPKFVSVLIDVLRDGFGEDSEIFVVESDASGMKCKYAFSMIGYDVMAKEKDVKLVNLSEEKSKIIKIEACGQPFKFQIPELLYKSDFVVNVPKIKYMNDVKITCALKNMFGCNAFPRKFIYHRALNEAIVAINKLVKTDLVVVDGLVVSGKYTKRLNLVMASDDPVAVDVAASKLMGINPKSVKQIVLASLEGLGSLGFSPVGEFSYFETSFPKKRLKDSIREIVTSTYLTIFHED
ncbi:DUF362 domain-containing protein [Candidatus Bathyarchaeota archaeon]|nr:DUF362 domain-containing protein [Candidatus Bathyarchaeota archaeon]